MSKLSDTLSFIGEADGYFFVSYKNLGKDFGGNISFDIRTSSGGSDIDLSIVISQVLRRDRPIVLATIVDAAEKINLHVKERGEFLQ